MKLRTTCRAYPGISLPVCMLLLAVFSTAPKCIAQSSGALSFEVATVKPVDPKNPPPPSVMVSGDRFQATGMTIKQLIKVAYDLNYGADRQVSGGPAWTASDRFDIDARVDAALGQKLPQLSSEERGRILREMLRSLLADRFKLQIRHESTELPIYELMVTKTGSKLLPSTSQITSGSDESGQPRSWIRFAGKGVLEGNAADMSTLVTALTMQPEIGGRLVVDKTGLTGKYDFTLKWTSDMGQGTDASTANSGPTLFTALREELGLQLESTRAPVDVIVIDQVQQPSAD